MKKFLATYGLFLKERLAALLIIFKYVFLILLGVLLFNVFLDNQLPYDEYKSLLPTILSTTGIVVAIIISFLFTKLYSEIGSRIERKRVIDKESKRITSFRRICHQIRISRHFWEPFGNLKKKLDGKFCHVRLRHYNSDKLNYESYNKFIKKVNYGEIGGQAYVGLKEIEGNVYSDYDFYRSIVGKNYSLDELYSIKEGSGSFWYFLDKYNKQVFDVSKLPKQQMQLIEKDLLVIYPNYLVGSIDNLKFREMFSDFQTSIINNAYYLTKINGKGLGKTFNQILTNLMVFSIVIILGVFILSLDYTFHSKSFDMLSLITLFLMNTFDLVINIVFAINKELKIKDFYEI